MKQLSGEIGRIVSEDALEIFKKEIAEKEFFPQEDYTSCLERAEDMMKAITLRATEVLALAIVNHRQKDHGEDREKEKKELMALLHDEDISIGLMSWWNH